MTSLKIYRFAILDYFYLPNYRCLLISLLPTARKEEQGKIKASIFPVTAKLLELYLNRAVDLWKCKCHFKYSIRSQRISISVDETILFREVACVQGDAFSPTHGRVTNLPLSCLPGGGSESRFVLTTQSHLTDFLNLLPHQIVNQSK